MTNTEHEIEIDPEQLMRLRAELTALRIETPYFCEQIDKCVWQVGHTFINKTCPDPSCEWCLLTVERWNQLQTAEHRTTNSVHLKAGESHKYSDGEYEAFLIITRDIGLRFVWARDVIESMLLDVIRAHVHALCGKTHCWMCTSNSYAEMRQLLQQRPAGRG